MTTVTLTTPISAHGQELSELTFREPTPEDVMAVGFPQLLIPSSDGQSVGIEVRAKIIGQYISRLAKIPPSSLKGMSLQDFQRCQGAIMGFFSQGDGEA